MSPINYFSVEEQQREEVWKTYGKDKKTLSQDITILKEWMQSQPHLPEILDDKLLENFFLLNKCSFERTKTSIDMYYTVRTKFPAVFNNLLKSEKIDELLKSIHYLVLPKLTKENYRIFVTYIYKPEALDDFTADDLLLLFVKIQEIRLKEDLMFGDIVIYDMREITFSFIKKLIPSYLIRFNSIYEKIFSIPVKAVYLIHSPPFMKHVLAVVKTVVKPKVFGRVLVCEDDSVLKTHLDVEILPKDFGGNEESLDVLTAKLKLKFVEYKARFESLEKLRVNEDLRPEKLKDDDWGFYGNFKQLDFD